MITSNTENFTVPQIVIDCPNNVGKNCVELYQLTYDDFRIFVSTEDIPQLIKALQEHMK